MKREIKFRGLTKDIYTGEWSFVYGLYVFMIGIGSDGIEQTFETPPTMDEPCGGSAYKRFEIKNDTLGQFIGITDNKGYELYEGDVVDIHHPCWSEKCVIEFKHGSFIFRCISKNDVQNTVVPGYTFMKEKLEVELIGNIHENKELITK